jgi:XTP/dITP diphosphohydrolase
MKPRQLCIATRNLHKLDEIRRILGDLEVQLRSCLDFPSCPDVVEDGATLEENAAKKAREVCEHTGLLTLADDTGLEVDALDGAPGVYSARWAGPGCTYADNNRKLLHAMAAVPESRRTARFRCVMALAHPSSAGPPDLFEGRIEGHIGWEARGDGGFGYDPVFVVAETGSTLAELSREQKNRISHRARALAAVRQALVLEWSQSA